MSITQALSSFTPISKHVKMSRAKPNSITVIHSKPYISTYPIAKPQPSTFSLRCCHSSQHSSLCRQHLPDQLNDGFLHIELEVRDYELDQYGVVNNAVYCSYCQLAHQKILDKIGFDTNTLKSNDGAIALAKLSLTFLAPLRSGDKFVLKVKVSNYSTARIFFDHYIYKLPYNEPILEAKAVGVLLGKNYRPLRLPTELKTKLEQFMMHQEGASNAN